MSFVLLVGLVITLAVVIAARRQRRALRDRTKTRPVASSSAEDSDA